MKSILNYLSESSRLKDPVFQKSIRNSIYKIIDKKIADKIFIKMIEVAHQQALILSDYNQKKEFYLEPFENKIKMDMNKDPIYIITGFIETGDNDHASDVICMYHIKTKSYEVEKNGLGG